MRKNFYYWAGAFCLVLSVVFVSTTRFPASKLTNVIIYDRLDTGYRDFYSIGFNMPKNSLRQGAVYLPIYSYREQECILQFLTAFSMEGAEITETDEYFEALDAEGVLRVYRFIDLLEYENLRNYASGRPISNENAVLAAQSFMDRFLPHQKPYNTGVSRDSDDGKIVVKFTGYLSNLPNQALTSQITLDQSGNIIRARHFFFDYEVLDAADIITVKSALAELPRDHDEKIHLSGYSLIYDFEDSVLMPFYHFEGKTACGEPFSYQVCALKFY